MANSLAKSNAMMAIKLTRMGVETIAREVNVVMAYVEQTWLWEHPAMKHVMTAIVSVEMAVA